MKPTIFLRITEDDVRVSHQVNKHGTHYFNLMSGSGDLLLTLSPQHCARLGCPSADPYAELRGLEGIPPTLQDHERDIEASLCRMCREPLEGETFDRLCGTCIGPDDFDC